MVDLEANHLLRSENRCVRGPKLVVCEGKTPYLPPDDVVRLIEAIPTDTLVGLRDRALIGVMAYTFARIGAAVGMNVGDYYPEGKQWALRFREKGGKRKQIAAHHKLEAYMDAYLDAGGFGEDKGTPLFRGVCCWRRSTGRCASSS